MKTRRSALYVRSIIFGVTDSLVSTVGLLAGIAVAGASQRTLILTGIVYAFVEAFSMAVGDFLSEESAEEYSAGHKVAGRRVMIAGMSMFAAFVVAAFIPILPYLLVPTQVALYLSVAFSVAALFIMGVVSARLARLSMVSRGFRMALLGGAAILIGVLVGAFVPAP